MGREVVTGGAANAVVFPALFTFLSTSPSLDFRAAQIMELLLGMGGLKAKRDFSDSKIVGRVGFTTRWRVWEKSLGFCFPLYFPFSSLLFFFLHS